MMDELKQQNDLADTLIQKLERIEDLWDGLPTQDDLEELARTAHALATCLGLCRETWMNGDFPSLDDLQELAKEAAGVAESLDAGKEQ
jgi:hypothetical protein